MKLKTVLLSALVLTACRDEQAGPKARPQPAQGQAPQAQTPTFGQNPQQPAQGPRTLDAVPEGLTWTQTATWSNGAVKYLGSKLEPKEPKAGQPVRVSHFFTATAEPPKGWSFFVHVIDADSKQQLGNADHEIQNGQAPLQTWPVGKIIEDQHMIQMPNYPGTLQFLLGFWQGNDRLPVDGTMTQDGNNRVFGPKLGSAPAGQQAVPEYHAPKAAKAPVIDGKLDDAAWAAAPAVSLVTSYDGQPVQRKTTAKLTWDDKFLYAAFDCEDPDVWGDLTKKDDPIYNEEVVEVFIDANGDGKTYNELQVSPRNVNFDAAFVARRSDLPAAMAWESGMKTAVQVNGTLDKADDQDKGWTAEFQIPLDKLYEVPSLPPKKGDKWKLNLYRLEHFERRKAIEGQAFSPLFAGDFHHLPRFGWLVFE